jgi:hypothetical protein
MRHAETETLLKGFLADTAKREADTRRRASASQAEAGHLRGSD